MVLVFGISLCLLLVTTAIHAVGMQIAMRMVAARAGREPHGLHRSRTYKVSVIVILMFMVSLAEVLVWAGTYVAVNAIEGIERAVYFSMVTYTTLGYGDIVLDENWRLLASFESANGIIMFGWSTAIIMSVVRRVYFKDSVR
jgi:hypothetical protein